MRVSKVRLIAMNGFFRLVGHTVSFVPDVEDANEIPVRIPLCVFMSSLRMKGNRIHCAHTPPSRSRLQHSYVIKDLADVFLLKTYTREKQKRSQTWPLPQKSVHFLEIKLTVLNRSNRAKQILIGSMNLAMKIWYRNEFTVFPVFLLKKAKPFIGFARLYI